MRIPDRTPSIAALACACALAAVPALASAPTGDAQRGDAARAALRGARAALDGYRAVVRRERRGPFAPVAGALDPGGAGARFGADRGGRAHAGQDLFAPAGTPLVAVSDATVVEAGSDGSQGNYVYLHDRRRQRTYVYMHLLRPAEVATGERVRAGQRIGAVGCTGSCWGDHLHFEVRAGRGIAGEPLDPLPLVEGWRRLDRPLAAPR